MSEKGVVPCVRVLAGSRFGLNADPPGRLRTPERRCRCPTVVAQPGAAKLQQLHHVPVMLRCSGAGPPARFDKSAVRTRLSSWGDFPIFSWRRRGDGRGPIRGLAGPRTANSADPPGRLWL